VAGKAGKRLSDAAGRGAFDMWEELGG